MPSGDVPSVLDSEPVVTITAAFVAAVDAGLTLAAAFNWIDITNGQLAAVGAFITALGALAAGVTRSQVWSARSVEALTRPHV